MSNRPIAGASTSIAAFAGVTSQGPTLQPVRVRSAAEARRGFGDVVQLEQFFRNGGDDVWVVRADDMAKGLKALDAVDPINILFLDHPAAPLIAAARDWCNARRAFLIADAPDPPQTFGPNVALYSPDLILDDGRTIGSSGTMAGIYARIDKTAGVWKAPSGQQATLIGVRDVTVRINDAQQGVMLGKGVNPIRAFPRIGIVAWGARTATDDSEWKYVPVRRLALYIEESLRRGLQTTAFEPNAARSAVTAFLQTLWRAGAFVGSKPEQAFFVTVSESEIIVGFAPMRPAEFVLIRIGGWTRPHP